MSNLKVQLKDGNNNLFPIPMLAKVDRDNILFSVEYPSGTGIIQRTTYTAIEDCFIWFGVCIVTNSVEYNIVLNGEAMYNYIQPAYTDNYVRSFIYPLRKGDVIEFNDGTYDEYVSVYGVKY